MKKIKIKKQKFTQKVALVFLAIMLADILSPTVTFALTGGPVAPEFSSFEPVTTTNMVNEFSGDFTYNIPVLNIPGANGGGYALSLSYHAGETSESEASWVGYGWTLNPGAINRGKKGLADDTQNNHTFYNDVPKNWTVSLGGMIGHPEGYSFDLPLSANASIRYNNYRGFGYTVGAGLSYRQGLVSLGYSISDGSGSFSAQVNPAALLSGPRDKTKMEAARTKYRDAKSTPDTDPYTEADNTAKRNEATKEFKAALGGNTSGRFSAKGALVSAVSAYGMHVLSDQQQPSTVTEYLGFSCNLAFSGQYDPLCLEAGFKFGAMGNYNEQKNTKEIVRTGRGYLYSSEAYSGSNENDVMDYSVEKESMYNKRDRYLSIPFAAADGFSVSGEGMSGGFRLHSKIPGGFRPNSVNSKTNIVQLSAEVHFGLFYGAGVTGGYGQQNVTVNGNRWDYKPAATIEALRFTSKDDGDEPFFFRYNGDLGGDLNYGDDGVISAVLERSGTLTPGFQSYTPNIENGPLFTSEISTANGSSIKRSGRSSYIAYHTNGEILQSAGYAYERSNTIVKNTQGQNVSMSAMRSNHSDQIGEIATVNEEGNTYVYGLPVYVKNETNLNYDLRGIAAGGIENNFLAYKDISNPTMKIGSKDNGAYASTYLLTQIITPDYVDRLLDGPSTDDFGGYTKFEYEKVHSNYHYRMPYAGLNYDANAMSDPLDDMGSYSSGDKEVYYVKQIVTKTYTAKFITSDRKDGLDAASDGTAASSNTAKGASKLKRLDAIELYTNTGKLIKKVIFKYDYSLCNGVLNSDDNSGNLTGKLTLKELWFEYEGIVKAKISPYQFKYEYPNIDPAIPKSYPEYPVYPAKYLSFQTEYENLNENPGYSKFSIDAWGNYQDHTTAEARFALMKNSVNPSPPADFDPAAWQLKVIKLPSGGEIHVQYEQDDYLYVQNRRATSFVSIDRPRVFNSNNEDIAQGITLDNFGDRADLLNVTDWQQNDFMDHPGGGFTLWDLVSTYVLNVSDIGVTSDPDKQKLVEQINQNLAGQKMYFKFLYSLLGGNPDIGKCNSEYITGYVDFRKAYVSGSGKVMIRVGSPTVSEYALPRNVCLDLVKKQKGGKINPIGSCDASTEGVNAGLRIEDIFMQLVSKIGTSFYGKAISCLEVNNSLSYFKIPVLNPKKGGGLRVKRILMYDQNGVDTNVPVLYGTEYIYKTEDGKSSGVATNEPATIREENALVTFLPKRQDKNWAEKIVAGFDKEQFEGPIGESLLPPPSVGYSRVVAKNIHSGKTNTGFVVSTFHTVKEFPFDMLNTYLGANSVDETTIVEEKDWLSIPALFVNYNVSNKWAAQGYRFIINDMHGKPQSVATYAGDYVNGDLKTFYKSSSTEYQYFNPGEPVPVMNPDGSINNNGHPGKEMDIAFEMKQVEDVTHDGSLEVDLGVGVSVIPIPGMSFLPTYSYNETKLRTHVTSKVIHYPAISKAVISSQDGITHTVENTVFSAYTGKPLITKTTDGYAGLDLPNDADHNGTYTSYTIPAYSQYKEMGPKAINERLKMLPGANGTPWENISITYSLQSGTSSLVFAASSGSLCDAMASMSKGDLIRLNNGANNFFHIDEVSGNTVTILPAKLINPITSISNGAVTSLEIVKSGRTNQLNTPAGGYVTYGGVPQNINPQFNLRKAFADQLTAALVSGGTITPAQVDPNLQFIDPVTNACTALNDNIYIKSSGGSGNIRINLGGSNILGTPIPNHPMPAYLNTLMNKYWKYEIPSSADGIDYDIKSIDLSCYGATSVDERAYTVESLSDIKSAMDVDVSSEAAHFPCVNGEMSDDLNLSMIPVESDAYENQLIPGLSLRTDPRNPSADYFLTSLNLSYNGQMLSYLEMGFKHPHANACTYYGTNAGGNYANGASFFENSTFANIAGIYAQDANGYLTFQWPSGVITTYNGSFGIAKIQFACWTVPPKCSTTIQKSGGNGQFDIDPETGALVYLPQDNPCSPQPVTCIQFCPTLSNTVSNVVASSATTFDCTWDYDASLYEPFTPSIGNVYETGVKGKWRPKENYVFKTSIVGGSKTGTAERNYKDAGTYDMTMFSWKDPGLSTTHNWVKTTTVTKYTPNGEASEEVDAIGIYSAAKFGYKGVVPYLVAQNSSSDYVAFESFENITNNSKFEDGVYATLPSQYKNTPLTPIAHSGTGSYQMFGTQTFVFKPFNIKPALQTSGLALKVWVKDLGRNPSVPIKAVLSYTGNTTPLSFNFIAQTGEWKLYESVVSSAILTAIPLNTICYLTFQNSNPSSNATSAIYIDDIRMQPMDAKVNTYVYDPATLRLLASFDDQHFGLYYQYNAEGKLVRKITETERGMKTIVETQYNTPSAYRDPNLH